MSQHARIPDNDDRYEQMLRLAGLFDAAGEEVRGRAGLGDEILRDPDVAESSKLSPVSYRAVEEEVRAATSGKAGLLSSSLELDTDALMVRATVLTYRWIDDLADVAGRSMGSVAGRAIGYLAPHVELGGAIVSAGLIETDPVEREDVTGYLSDLAENNPGLMNHVSTGGGLLEGLQLRTLLTTAGLAGEQGRLAALGGLQAVGVESMVPDVAAALRDAAAGLADPEEPTPAEPTSVDSAAPRGVADLMSILAEAPGKVSVQQIAPHRYIAYLPGPHGGPRRRLRLVGGDHSAYAATVVAAIERAVAGDPDAQVMLVGSAQGGVTAAEVAATVTSQAFRIDQVVTAGAPSSHVLRIPATTRVLSLEDRSDPVALLGSLLSAGTSNRLTVVVDSATDDEDGHVAGGRAVDAADHPDVRAEIQRIRTAGFFTG